jgi:hypothetical protein
VVVAAVLYELVTVLSGEKLLCNMVLRLDIIIAMEQMRSRWK